MKRAKLLTRATIHDLPLINRWLILPEIQRWWGCPVSTQIEMRLGVMVPDSMGQVFLIKGENGSPVGLISVIHTRAMARSPIGWPKYLPRQAFEVGILIADRQHRQRGLGSKALLEAHRLVLAPTVDPVFAWIEKDNKASLACFAKLGYVRVFESATASYSSALLRYEPDANRQ